MATNSVQKCVCMAPSNCGGKASVGVDVGGDGDGDERVYFEPSIQASSVGSISSSSITGIHLLSSCLLHSETKYSALNGIEYFECHICVNRSFSVVVVVVGVVVCPLCRYFSSFSDDSHC